MRKSLLKLIISSLGVLIFFNSASPQQKIVGYYPTWSDMPFNNLELNNLTHIIQAFALPNPDGSIALSGGIPNPDLVMAAHSTNVKILISFANDTSDSFGKISADSSLRSVFISNIAQFLSTNHYDGIDIDWEFPTTRQSGQLTVLVKELRQKFNMVDSTWLITMAVPAGSFNGQNFQYENMKAYIDWYSIMGYDFHGSWSNHTGHNAPLYKSPKDSDGDDSSSVQYMNIVRRIPASKLLLGVPFYGKEFDSKGLYQPLLDSVVSALTYSEIIGTVSPRNWNYYWDSVSYVPYYMSDDSTKFITFDDTLSIKLKTKFSISKKLGGVMIWALGQDLINNNQPLLEVIGRTIHEIPTAVTDNRQKDLYSSSGYNLFNNYPNPFNPSTIISWHLADAGFVTLKIYDVLGREVETLVNGYQNAGAHSIIFNSNRAPYSSGVYFYKLSSGNYISVKKMMLIK